MRFGHVLVMQITDLILPMRVDESSESIGLDVSQHGEKLGVHVDDEEFLAKVRILTRVLELGQGFLFVAPCSPCKIEFNIRVSEMMRSVESYLFSFCWDADLEIAFDPPENLFAWF